MNRYRITLDGSKWRMKQAGTHTTILTVATKRELILQMGEYMRDKIGSVKIHKCDGTFQEERTYPRKHDPIASKG